MSEPTTGGQGPAARTAPEPAAAPEGTAVPAEAVAPAAGSAGGDCTDSRTTDIIAGPGGVMTREVGVVTGDLTLRSELSGGEVTLHVQYKDAAEWYVVTGGRAPLNDPADLDAVHTIAVALLHRPEG